MVKQTTKDYFEQLFGKDPDGIRADRPWMDSRAADRFKAEAIDDPFIWPQLIEIHNFRRLLHKGNQSPSPGPDGVEKWVLAEMDESDLEVIRKLLSFVLSNNYFDKLRDHYILPMYKNRGLYTELTNYRAVCFGPLLAILVTSWFTTLAQEYAMRRRLIPETQTAVQSGTQHRDLTSFLSQVQAWA
ncbi:BQ2448_6119 [Microbotryum intermedium]|uniref:BQ2448_6119 protein n=1 Tax=Microbotryum intermedium TaxID=269621 RepID=A0A238FLN4_9BASI|nr:BQ2448_6119 [Microbotryum intermedium]